MYKSKDSRRAWSTGDKHTCSPVHTRGDREREPAWELHTRCTQAPPKEQTSESWVHGGGGVVTYPQVYHRDAPHRTRSEGVHVGPN